MGKEKDRDIKSIIESIDLSEEQGEALTQYIASYLNEWKTQIEEKVRSEVAKGLTEDYNGKAKVFQERLRKALTEEITEKLTKELSDKITADKEAEMNKKINEALDVANSYYSSKFAMFVQEAVAEIEKSINEEREASSEVKSFREIVGVIQPFVETVDNTKLIDIVESQDKTIKMLEAKYETLLKEKTIAECLADTPEAHKDSMRKFLDQAATQEEVAEKFEHAVQLIKNTRDIFEGKGADDDGGLDIEAVNEGRRPMPIVNEDDDVDLEALIAEEEEEDNFPQEDDDFFPDNNSDDEDNAINEDKNVIEEDYFADGLETKTPAPLNEGQGDKNEGDAELQKTFVQNRLEQLIGAELLDSSKKKA